MISISAPRNQILSQLDQIQLSAFLSSAEMVELSLRQIIYAPNEPIGHVYFPESGLVSIITPLSEGTALESGVIGKEGFAGLSIALGVGFCPAKAICQVEGNAWRIPANRFSELLSTNKIFAKFVYRYIQKFLNQVSQTSACNGSHTVEERCARWLLMTRDRCEEDTFVMTQEFLATMLGVRRTGVNLVAGNFQKANLITYARGRITILNREQLERLCCGCYRATVEAAERIDELS